MSEQDKGKVGDAELSRHNMEVMKLVQRLMPDMAKSGLKVNPFYLTAPYERLVVGKDGRIQENGMLPTRWCGTVEKHWEVDPFVPDVCAGPYQPHAEEWNVEQMVERVMKGGGE